MQLFSVLLPNIEINVLEVTPAEAIDLLYARQLNVAVVAEDSLAASNLSFAKKELFADLVLIFADKLSLCAFPITAFLLIPPIISAI